MNKQNFITMPKFEMHLHIEGTMYPEFFVKKAKEKNIKLAFDTPEEYYVDYRTRNTLQKFLMTYYGNMRVLENKWDFYDLAWEHAKRASEQNIRYAEIFFDPQPHLYRGVKFDEIVNGLYEAFQDAKKKLNFRAQLIMCFLKDLPEYEAEEVLELAKSAIKQNKIIAIGFDSSESPNWVQRFQKVVLKARFLGLKVVSHCQENVTDQSAWDVLHYFQPNRIDHGFLYTRIKKFWQE
ncbi:adenosine deaminase family protein [Spiroplasma floricola]|uniref:Adenine deaminase n=1 Tax=Spiroplasma floricola 23-6 TaxID=1336749 RepID=A0A2K8SCZ5_9MOLU|nr:hypothetical protein [Spiroplasma floricola]AUB31303.1 adenine deaminase [Spiroplasma floricola 23-6]